MENIYVNIALKHMKIRGQLPTNKFVGLSQNSGEKLL